AGSTLLRFQTIDDFYGCRIYADGRGIKTGAGGGQFNCAGGQSGADGNAVDATFGVEPEVVDRFHLAAVVAAAPDGGAFEFKIDARFVSRATASLGIDDFDIKERDIGTVRLQSLRAD